MKAVQRGIERVNKVARFERAKNLVHLPGRLFRRGFFGMTTPPVRHHAPWVTLLRQQRLKAYTLAAVAASVNRRGIRTRRNSPWSHEFVCQLLTRHPNEIA